MTRAKKGLKKKNHENPQPPKRELQEAIEVTVYTGERKKKKRTLEEGQFEPHDDAKFDVVPKWEVLQSYCSSEAIV